LGAETEIFLKGGQCGKFCKNEGPFGKKIDKWNSSVRNEHDFPSLNDLADLRKSSAAS
jgi:hypothetical protein